MLTARQYIDPPFAHMKTWDWKTVRSYSGTPMHMPVTYGEWLAVVNRTYVQEARDLAKRFWGLTGITSVGCGCGYLEENLRQRSPIPMIATDMTFDALQKLGGFLGMPVLVRDFRKEDFIRLGSHMAVIAFRVDTELSDKEWRETFAFWAKQNIETVFFIPARTLTFRLWLRFIRTWLRGGLHSGWVRSESSQRSLWASHYRISEEFSCGSHRAFRLERYHAA